MSGETQRPILEAKGLTKRYGHVTALDGADFELYPGEILAVIGDNGAGKSTLIKALSGALIPDEGQIYLNGEQVHFHSPIDARNYGIETVYQDLAVAPALNIMENIFLGREIRRSGILGSVFRMLDKKKMLDDTTRYMEDLKIGIRSMNQSVGTLSGGQRQGVAVARSAAFASNVVIMDEPTAALGVKESRMVMKQTGRQQMPASRSDPLLVGLDIGTTNIKAVIFDLRGRVVGQASARTPTRAPRPGWAYYRHDEIWDRTIQALKEALGPVDDPARIAGIAVASIGETGFPLNEHGECIYDGIAWYDRRTEPQAAAIEALIGADRLYEITGLPPGSIYTLCKQLWLKENEPDVYARIHTWLNTADYIAYRLCGVPASDFSLASRMLAMDISGMAWSETLIETVGLNPAIFPTLCPSGTRLDVLLPAVAAELGLSQETVVSVGGHDHLCGAMAIGVTEPGIMLLSIGTAAGILVPIRQPLTDPEAGRKGFEMGAHVSGGYYGMPSYRTAGVCVEWFRDTFAPESDFAALTAEAEDAPPGASGVRFLPHMRLPHSPHNDPKSRGAFVGLSTDVNRGAMFRAVLEGLAFEMRSTGEPFLADANIGSLTGIKAIGGGTKNRLLIELAATVLKQRIDIIEVTQATALGAALLGGIGAGIFADVADAQARLDYSTTAVDPNRDQVELYDTIYREVYSGIYDALRPLNHANHELKYE